MKMVVVNGFPIMIRDDVPTGHAYLMNEPPRYPFIATHEEWAKRCLVSIEFGPDTP